ncbi:MAG: universal stress protein [Acidimicrobiales bacterium]|nr:universal stress protein [Acidimicrobiales bacterium]
MKVLIAVDHDRESRDAVAFAKNLLDEDDHAIVVNVASFDIGPAMAMASYSATYADPAIDHRLHMIGDEAEEAAEDVAEGAVESLGGSAEPRVEFGDVADRICQVAEDEAVDLVILGTHDRGRFARLWFGSVSDLVVHDAPCSVLVVR